MTLLVYVLGPNQNIFEMYRAMGIRSNTETLFKYRHFFTALVSLCGGEIIRNLVECCVSGTCNIVALYIVRVYDALRVLF
jgi:hypothetical protein